MLGILTPTWETRLLALAFPAALAIAALLGENQQMKISVSLFF